MVHFYPILLHLIKLKDNLPYNEKEIYSSQEDEILLLHAFSNYRASFPARLRPLGQPRVC